MTQTLTRRSMARGPGRSAGAACLAVAVLACGPDDVDTPAAGRTTADSSVQGSRMELPEAVSNNAVAAAQVDGETVFFSFNGLGSGKGWQDVTNRAYGCAPARSACRAIPQPPIAEGRLASAAVTVGNRIYLLGGYTVGRDGAEVSAPEVFAFDPALEAYDRMPDMPVPVDDAVALPYRDRFIYVVSGWHDSENVGLVQVFDAETRTWFNATDFPGTPVFGHAGGAVGRQIVIADGVGVLGDSEGRRTFGAVAEAWLGTIDPIDPARIIWSALPPHPFAPLYRMAAAGHPEGNRVLFFGGADNPYNYDGIGYDGTPAGASSALFAFDFDSMLWEELGHTREGGMDYRGLLLFDGNLFIMGGMNEKREVVAEVRRLTPD